MASSSSAPLHTIRNPLVRRSSSSSSSSLFIRKSYLLFPPFKRTAFTPTAKFDLSELMGGRGLCNGEEGIMKELKKNTSVDTVSPAPQSQPSSPHSSGMGDGSFEKELLGLTGGFPGGEKGLQLFIEKNPPPQKKSGELGVALSGAKPMPPELPLLMPGMIVIVKNPGNPFHMYTGIVQRVTDGKAGVLFEGGNWDKLITFQLDELERREKGPPMVNPKSAVIESIVENLKKE